MQDGRKEDSEDQDEKYHRDNRIGICILHRISAVRPQVEPRVGPTEESVSFDIFPFQRRGQQGKSRKALPRCRQPSIQQSTESNHNHEARWRVQVGSRKTTIQPTLYRTFFDPGIQSSLPVQRKSRRSRISQMVGTSRISSILCAQRWLISKSPTHPAPAHKTPSAGSSKSSFEPSTSAYIPSPSSSR